jgi:hypothetical protein
MSEGGASADLLPTAGAALWDGIGLAVGVGGGGVVFWLLHPNANRPRKRKLAESGLPLSIDPSLGLAARSSRPRYCQLRQYIAVRRGFNGSKLLKAHREDREARKEKTALFAIFAVNLAGYTGSYAALAFNCDDGRSDAVRSHAFIVGDQLFLLCWLFLPIRPRGDQGFNQ